MADECLYHRHARLLKTQLTQHIRFFQKLLSETSWEAIKKTTQSNHGLNQKYPGQRQNPAQE